MFDLSNQCLLVTQFLDRVMVQPPRMATPQQRAANLAAIGELEAMVEDNDGEESTVVGALGSRRRVQQPAKLSKVKRVSDEWQEWSVGIGGNLPLKKWTKDDIKSRGGTEVRRVSTTSGRACAMSLVTCAL